MVAGHRQAAPSSTDSTTSFTKSMKQWRPKCK
jgi:hypothetical protein